MRTILMHHKISNIFSLKKLMIREAFFFEKKIDFSYENKISSIFQKI